MKKIKYVLYTIAVLFVIYLLMCFIDINMHNMSDRQYSPWNTFAITKAGTKLYNKQSVKEQNLTMPGRLYTEENLLLLAQLLEAENGSGKDETIYLTGVVVLKRVKSKDYPNTIKGVITQKGQYSTASKLSNVKPSDRCLEIAEELLIYGVDEYPDSLVYQSMFSQGRKTYKVIDGEYFCLK